MRYQKSNLLIFFLLCSGIQPIERGTFDKICDNILEGIRRKDVKVLESYFSPELLLTSVDAEDAYTKSRNFDGFLHRRGDVYESFLGSRNMPRHPGFPSVYNLLANQRKLTKVFDPVEDARWRDRPLVSGYGLRIIADMGGQTPESPSQFQIDLFLKCNASTCKISGFYVEHWHD